ncbi:hypothetical protein ACS0TY_028105 [Phlomoides rotata]
MSTIEACILLHAAPLTPFPSCTHSPCTNCVSPSSLANVARCRAIELSDQTGTGMMHAGIIN